ncbi:hypothetical protein [Aliivibrio fischeri]|uniref:hypothetical protein n=1 Tax=Aliivibrio fischeri TaxID=668 RepID=UPI0006D0EBC9|nr:hypothetical protein [Aliivibrio fischeri]USR97156.1 hypothetical protein AVFI_18415 [Aliivibrio fischeri ATCC 7744 = JCM 18803 = DSM 507]GGK50584.1 hypothetical protein GCM10007987_37090 [Aliivibrio fischeri]
MKTIFVEESYSSFEDLHDKKWIENIFIITKGKGLDSIVDDFVNQWWGTARMFTLPWLASIPDDNLEKTQIVRWDSLFNNIGFNGAIWKVAESSYCSFYYAYECLLVSLLSYLEQEDLRVTDRKFNSLLIKYFGESGLSRYWSSKSISISRELRNSIVHNGGKVTVRLQKLGYDQHLSGDHIKVAATDVRLLHTTLQMLVTDLIHTIIERRS